MKVINPKKIAVLIRSIMLSTVFCSVSYADIVPDETLSSTPRSDGQTSIYLKNLGQYFGFDITQACDNNSCLQKPGSTNNSFQHC